MTVLLLSSCASSQAYKEGNLLLDEGKYEAGLSKLQDAVKLDPHNLEYRITYSTKKLSTINVLNSRADIAWRKGNLSDAEKAYLEVLRIDPYNGFAKQGLESIIQERRHKQIVEEADGLFKKGGSINLNDAIEKLRFVLSENPNQQDALNLKDRINQQLEKNRPGEAQLNSAFRKPITLEFKDAPIRSVFDVISKVSGLNFFFDKDVRPDIKATILAKRTSVEDAIRLLLVTNQLEETILNDNSILIYPNTAQKIKDYQNLSVRSFYLANADVKAVSNTIKTMLKTKDLVTDERLGLIFMRDTPDVIKMAERIIALQDLSDPEVMLEVEVMEVKRSRLMDFGIDWPSQMSLSLAQQASTNTTGATGATGATGTTPAPATTPLTLASFGNINKNSINVSVGSVTLNAMKQDADSNILANPRIRVRNKEKAKILIGDRVPVITTTSTSTGFVADSVSYVDVGLKLDVEPNIYLDNEVAIKINLEVSSIVNQITSKSGTLAYQIGTRNATTVLRLKDGETQVLAGLISDEDRRTANKVPGLGELPVLNRLFGSLNSDSERSEIVLSITPHIVRSIRRPDLMSAEFNSGTESIVGSKGLALGAIESESKSEEEKKATNQSAAATKAGNNVSVAGAAVSNNGATPADASTSDDTKKQDATNSGTVNFSWQGPSQVKVGDQFSAVLKVSSQGALQSLPLLLGFDPAVLQIVNVQEGDFLKQANGQTTFNNRVDPIQGKVFVADIRQTSKGADSGINGTGSAVMLNFKAIKAAPAGTKLQLLSATPEPAPSSPVSLPVDMPVKIQ